MLLKLLEQGHLFNVRLVTASKLKEAFRTMQKGQLGDTAEPGNLGTVSAKPWPVPREARMGVGLSWPPAEPESGGYGGPDGQMGLKSGEDSAP